MRFENPIGAYGQELNSFLYLLSNRNINNSLLSYCLCSKLCVKPICVLIYWTLLTLEVGLLVGIIAIYSCSSRQRLFAHNKEIFWKEIIPWKSWETQVGSLWQSFNFNLRSISWGTNNEAELTLMASFRGIDLEEPAPILLDSVDVDVRICRGKREKEPARNAGLRPFQKTMSEGMPISNLL